MNHTSIHSPSARARRFILLTLILLTAVLIAGLELLAGPALVGPAQAQSAGVSITTPPGGLVTREYGNTESFFTGVTTIEAPKSQTYVDVALDAAPTVSVTVPFQSSDTSEGTIAPDALVFTPDNWDAPQRVTISAVDDSFYITETDSSNNDVGSYTLEILPLQSGDPAYDGLDPADMPVTNQDNEIDSADAFGGHELSIEDIGHSNETYSFWYSNSSSTTYLSLLHDAQNGSETVDTWVYCTAFVLDDEHINIGFIPDPDYPGETYASKSVTTSGSRYGVVYRFGGISNGRVEYTMRLNRAIDLTPGVGAYGDDPLAITAAGTTYTSANVPNFNCLEINAPGDSSLTDSPPVGAADAYSTDDIEVLTVAAPQGVLSNDSETGEATYGRPLRAKLLTPPAAGRLNLMPDGAFTYTPTVKYSGVVTFTYQARQNQMVDTTPVTVSINVATRVPDHLYAATEESGCYTVHPCLWGTDSLQESLDYVNPGGAVTALGVHTTTAAITNRATAVTLEGGGGHELRWNGGAGALFDVNGGGAFTVKGMEAVCVGSCASSAIFSQSAGSINAYANNFSGFAVGYSGSGAADLGQNWWGVANGTNPGLPAADWARRLGAPAAQWADGAGSVQLGAAQLGGGSGTAVIISHGRAISTSLPFGVGVAGEADQVCSDYYDYFVRSGSGSWDLTLPVDDTAACNSTALANQLVYFITDVTECGAADSGACWDLVTNNVSTSGQTLVVGSLTAGQLGGTPVVAGTPNNADPTALRLGAVTAAQRQPAGWVLALVTAAGVLSLLLLTATVAVRRR